MRDLALLAICYLLGSIPFAYLAFWLHSRQDIRARGNGNVGTRNVIRLLGLRWGLLVLLLDAIKGAAAYWLVVAWGAEWLLYAAPVRSGWVTVSHSGWACAAAWDRRPSPATSWPSGPSRAPSAWRCSSC